MTKSPISFLSVKIPRLRQTPTTAPALLHERALAHAAFETQPDLKGSVANGAVADPQPRGHLPVMLDFPVAFVEVVVENQVALAGRQTLETMSQALVLFAALGLRVDAAFDQVSASDFFSTKAFANDVSGDAVEVTGRLTKVVCSDVRQANHHAVDRFVRKIFSVAEALRDKYPHQTRADG